MTVRRLLTVFATVAAIGAGTAARAETLADALTHAYSHSGLLDQNRALLRAADEDVVQAVAATRPVVNWAANASIQNPRTPGSDLIQATISVAASLTIYDAGAGQLAVEAQKELVLATRQSLINVEQQVLLNAVQAYMDVRRDSENLALRQSNVRLITQELRAAQDRFDVGEVTRTDVSLAEARLAAARSLLASAQGSLARSQAAYKNAVGHKPNRPQSANAAPVSRSLANAIAFAHRNHPQMKEAQHSVSAAELSIQRGRAAMSPTVSITGEYGIDQDGNLGQRVGIGAQGPIYAGGRLSSQVRQLMARRDQARAGLHITKHAVEQQVANAYSFLEVARAARQAADQQIRAATVAFRGVREEATLGTRTTLDVLNAEQELLDARANAISAQADEVVASYSLLSSMGLLTAQHLNLPVQQYDPAAYYNLVKDAPSLSSEQGQALDRVLQAIGK